MSIIIRDDLPENALVNVRHKLEIFFGGSNKVNPDLLDYFANEAVKVIHRRWHPLWAISRSDQDIPATTGLLELSSDFKKVFNITTQALAPETTYVLGTDYELRPYNANNLREIQWIEPPTEDLAIRINYYRKPTNATADTDLLDIEPDAIDLVEKGAKYLYFGQKSNLPEYDRYKSEFEEELQMWIDDDTQPDNLDTMRKYNADMTESDYESGELV